MSKTQPSHHPALPWIMFISLALIWGSSFILMKRGLTSFTYTQVGTLRVSIAALFMSVIGFRHFKLFERKDLVSLAIVGFLGNAIPYVLFPLAVNHLDSGVVGIINSLVPLFTVLIGGWFFRYPADKRAPRHRRKRSRCPRPRRALCGRCGGRSSRARLADRS